MFAALLADSVGLYNLGGIVGWDDLSTPTIANCLNNGTFPSTNTVSPIARVDGRGTIDNCYATKQYTSNGDRGDDRGIVTNATGEVLRALLGDKWIVDADGDVVPLLQDTTSVFQDGETVGDEVLTGEIATWLNGLMSSAGMTKDAYKDAIDSDGLTLEQEYLLNTDPTKATTVEFKISGISIGSTVDIQVSLVRMDDGTEVSAPINGVLKIYGSPTIDGPTPLSRSWTTTTSPPQTRPASPCRTRAVPSRLRTSSSRPSSR